MCKRATGSPGDFWRRWRCVKPASEITAYLYGIGDASELARLSGVSYIACMETKSEIYERVGKEIAAVIDGETSATARYATAACLLNQAFEDFFWTGFYVVDPLKPDQLVVGPYQGTLGCLRIPFGRGVCGASAQKRETIIVDDVHAFPGHIACDSQTNSEIVVPVLTKAGDLAAVLDVDSTKFKNFDAVDKTGLEAICENLLLGVKA